MNEMPHRSTLFPVYGKLGGLEKVNLHLPTLYGRQLQKPVF